MRSLCLSRGTWLALTGLLVGGMLGFYGTLGAAPQAGQPPFANPVDQRAEMIRELREIKELLKEQNALLRGGGNKHAGPPGLH
jgi:gas vesicle protein